MAHSLKIILFAFFNCLTILPLLAQVPVEGAIYWVEFTDKGDSQLSQAFLDESLSEKALARRQKYGISLSEDDFPVNPRYVSRLSDLGATVLGVSRWLNGALVSIEDKLLLEQVRDLPFVKKTPAKRAKKSRPIKKVTVCPKEALSLPNSVVVDSIYGGAWRQLSLTRGEALHQKGFRGEGVVIAVIDEGFYGADAHTAFDSLRNSGRLLGYRDFSMQELPFFSYERSNHGSKVLSCMAANSPGEYIGTAPDASYWLLSSEHQGKESPIEEYCWVFAAEFADSVGVDIISSSLGYGKFDNPADNYSYADFYKYRSPSSRAAACAWRKGIVVLVSAGNEGNTGWRYHLFPGETPEIITVGAAGNDGYIAEFSSVGYPVRKVIKPDIVAPGASVFLSGSNSGYLSQDGTSFATPLVSGLVACLLQANPALTNNEIKRLLLENASLSASPNRCCGYGVPDFRKTMEAVTKPK